MKVMNKSTGSKNVFCAVVVAVIFIIGIGYKQYSVWKSKSDLNQFQKQFQFSLEGLNITCTDYLWIPAFQDPSGEYIVTVENDVSGTVFDTYLMEDGISEEVWSIIQLQEKDTVYEGKEPIIELDSGGSYKSRMLISKYEDRLIIVYDILMNQYYVYYISF